jgi:hypothetical protein
MDPALHRLQIPGTGRHSLAFEGLLGWTAAVETQSQRVTAAQVNLLAAMDRRSAARKPQEMSKLMSQYRLAFSSFETERQLFCNAAHKLLEHRIWVKQLGFIDEALFDDLDKFTDDIKVMRDMNEHAIEYFKGKGKRPQDWIYVEPGQLQADASSTFGTKIGGRLDWVELGGVAERLLAKLSLMGPFFPAQPAGT